MAPPPPIHLQGMQQFTSRACSNSLKSTNSPAAAVVANLGGMEGMEPLKGTSWGSGGIAREKPGSVRAVVVGGAREACMSSTCWGVAAGGWYAQIGGLLLLVVVSVQKGNHLAREVGSVEGVSCWVARGPAEQGPGGGRRPMSQAGLGQVGQDQGGSSSGCALQ